MRKSNGRRAVNKTDGSKKLGKRALTKSRRNDEHKVIQEEIDQSLCKKCGKKKTGQARRIVDGRPTETLYRFCANIDAECYGRR